MGALLPEWACIRRRELSDADATLPAAGVPSGRESPLTEQQAPGSSWHGQLSHWLGNPLLVTVVAALLGSLLLPEITRKWQDHQKALEIQTGLVSDMSTAVSGAVANSRFIAAGLVARSSSSPGAEQQAWNGVYRDWTTSSASIGAKLRAYLGPAVSADWQQFGYVVTDFVALSAQERANSGRQQQVEEIFRYRDRLKGVTLTPAQWRLLAGPRSGAQFQDTYAAVSRALLTRQDELVQEVLDSKVSGF